MEQIRCPRSVYFFVCGWPCLQPSYFYTRFSNGLYSKTKRKHLSFRIDKFILLSRFAILVEKVLPILTKNFNVFQLHSQPFLLSFNRASRKTLSPHRLCRCRNGQEYQSHMFCEWTGIYWLV